MNPTRRLLTLFTLLLTWTVGAQAEFVGLNIGTPGQSDSVYNSIVDPDNQGTLLGSDYQPTPSLLFVLEHPISALPNIRYQGTDLDSKGSDSLYGGSASFSNEAYGAGTNNSTYLLDQNDIVLYYNLMDNWMNLDFGLDLKSFDGEVTLNESGIDNTVLPIDETVPLFYVSARFNLPFDGFYLGADINSNFRISSTVAEDSTFMLGYQTDNGIRVEGGIKRFSLDLNNSSDVDTNLEYDGLFLQGYIPF
jgi:outer membrane protein